MIKEQTIEALRNNLRTAVAETMKKMTEGASWKEVEEKAKEVDRLECLIRQTKEARIG